jgi:hypothetical protein
MDEKVALVADLTQLVNNEVIEEHHNDDLDLNDNQKLRILLVAQDATKTWNLHILLNVILDYIAMSVNDIALRSGTILCNVHCSD